MNNGVVHVTKSNTDQILQLVDLHQIDVQFDQFYLSDIRQILSLPELNYLSRYRGVLDNPDVLLSEKYIKKDFRDTKRYVYENIYPAYHCSPVCERLNATFENYEIPAGIYEWLMTQFKTSYQSHQANALAYGILISLLSQKS